MGARLDNVSPRQGLSGEYRERLLNTNMMAMEQHAKLEQGKRTALEAEGVAIETMKNLQGQREQLERASYNNRDIADNLSRSNKLITTMTKRAIANKAIMFGVIALMVLLMIFIVYMKVS